MSQPDQISDFQFESVLFESERLSTPIELSNAVTDLEITEDINLPFLTGRLVIVDHANMLSGVDYLGGETITIKIVSTVPESSIITKTFYLTKLKDSQKSDNHGDTHTFELVEDIMFHANLQNINKSYSGKTSEIISKISKNFLNKEVSHEDKDIISSKIIVPNLNPIEAMSWLKDKAYTVDGYPFYLFSTLALDKLVYLDLGSMIGESPINQSIPFRWSPDVLHSIDPTVIRRILIGYEYRDTEDLYSYIHRGLVGAEYEFIDTTKNKKNTFKFDIVEDALLPLVEKTLPKDQNSPLYSDYYKYNEKSFNEYKNRKISYIGGSSAFKSPTSNILSYYEKNNIAEYKNNIISRTLREFINKAPITIRAQGLDFIGGEHATIGNNIRVHFLNSNPDANLSIDEIPRDSKKSGDYLIVAARYKFTKMPQSHKCTVSLSCVKPANYSTLEY